jgi:uncharacterized Ntn-hydrolase superfamily protein
MEHPLTWSIVARDPATGALGVVVATHPLAVGARCPLIRAGVGAVATQSITNPALAPAILDRLAAGASAGEALAAAIGGDDGRDLRQVHVVDRTGRVAAWTGRHCVETCGDLAAEAVSVAGNMLAGAAVLARTLAMFQERADLALAERLVAAMAAGEGQGGDCRGTRSAALQVATDAARPALDLRVDGDAAPIAALHDLLARWRAEEALSGGWTPKQMPPGLDDMDTMEAAWRARGLALKFRR